MNYLKYFLFSLILLWLLGFIYVFKSGNYSSGSANKNGNEDDDADSFYQRRSRSEFKRLEEELQRLEMKNKKNELIIKSLQEQARKLSVNQQARGVNNDDSPAVPISTDDSACKWLTCFSWEWDGKI